MAGDFIGDRECVTHHYACDCRERRFREQAAEIERLRGLLRDVWDQFSAECVKDGRSYQSAGGLSTLEDVSYELFGEVR